MHHIKDVIFYINYFNNCVVIDGLLNYARIDI